MHQIRPERRKDAVIRSGFFLGALLFHIILFVLLATYVIWPAPPPPPTDQFHGVAVKTLPPPPQPPSSGGAANNPQFEPQPVVVPVVTPPSLITSANKTAFTVDASKVMDQALNHLSDQMAQSSGLTSGGGGNFGTGIGSGFGTSLGSSNQLEGYLYDLKQTADRHPTGMTPERYHRILTDFVNKGWNESVLASFYKSSKPLYTTHILIPNMDAAAGPKAFGLEKEVQPKMWIVWYKGKVAAPASGNYCFAGFGDDILLVRLDGNTVFDGSIIPVAPKFKTDYPWPNAWKKLNPWYGPKYGQLRKGPSVPMTGGLDTNIDIIIGEEPGGEFNAALFVFQADKTYSLDRSGQPLLPLFQMAPGPATFDGEHPPIGSVPEPWQGASR